MNAQPSRGSDSPNAPGQISDITRRNIETVEKMKHAADRKRTLGQRVADSFAAVVGSWTFIIVQSVLLIAWMALNLMAWTYRWDPYPFILLNLVLSFQAAFASPIIMMSQNRQAELADKRNHLDLQINLLAEEENTEMLALLRQLCEHVGLKTATDGAAAALEEPTHPEEIVDQIDQSGEKAQQAAAKTAPPPAAGPS